MTDVAVVGTDAFITAGGDLRTIDLTDLAAPTQVGSLSNVSGHLAVAGSLLYASSSVSFKVIDISAPVAPALVGSAALGGQDIAVAGGLADNLITRCADVCLKERRRLVLLTREAPLSLVHLRNMVSVTESGGIIFPPVAAFYAGLSTLDDMVDQTVARVLDVAGIESPTVRRWSGVADGLAEARHSG